MAITALIFDFDGLILDTETPDYTVLAQQYREHGAELLTERWVLGLGTAGGYDPYAELEQLTGQTLDHGRLHAEHRQRYLEIIEQQPLRPGVTALLAYAAEQGLRCAVASSSVREWVEGWLERHALRHWFQCVRTRSDGLRVKPAPDLFVAAAACLACPPAECVVLEDSPNGMRAAAAASMRCVAVPLPLLAALELPAHTLKLNTLADLPPAALVERLKE